MKERQDDITMRALVNEAANAYNEGNTGIVTANMTQIIETYLGNFDSSDADIMNTMIVMLKGLENYPAVLAVTRVLAKVSDIAPFELGPRYFRALAASNEVAKFDDFVKDGRDAIRGHHILIACIPKTGSTFLQSNLMMITDSPGPKLGLSYANEENMLHPETVRALSTTNLVAQEHCRATPQNLAVVQGFGMKVIVLVRNIFDNLLSMRDMLASNTYGSVVALFQNHMPEMDNESQMDAIITKWAHWQLDFYTSWVRAQRDGLVQAQFWTYEDIMQDKVAAVGEICRQAGVKADPLLVQGCVDAVDGNADLSRKNVGISGRGRVAMTDAQVQSIQSMTRFYPDIDFRPLGL